MEKPNRNSDNLNVLCLTKTKETAKQASMLLYHKQALREFMFCPFIYLFIFI